MKRSAFLAIVLTLLAVPAFAADDIISGVDLWKTPGDGSTYASFASDPIPADFFCSGSRPFLGKIVFEGAPVATSPPDLLGETDTIIQRLDDAVFNREGVAHTRIQVRALSFISVEPLKTRCGAFNVQAVLAGEQRVTDMVIYRDSKGGGHWRAPISVNIKLIFTPVNRPVGESLEIAQSFDFAPAENAQWAAGDPRIEVNGYVLVDTDGNDMADTFLPGTSSNFVAGVAPTSFRRDIKTKMSEPVQQAPICHLAQGHMHCPLPAGEQTME
ncbi:MAG: hypothetical protein GY856_49125 [bacterium]|nr:hypothetical protein [bacterium]